jgi:hypothetical protein
MAGRLSFQKYQKCHLHAYRLIDFGRGGSMGGEWFLCVTGGGQKYSVQTLVLIMLLKMGRTNTTYPQGFFHSLCHAVGKRLERLHSTQSFA